MDLVPPIPPAPIPHPPTEVVAFLKSFLEVCDKSQGAAAPDPEIALFSSAFQITDVLLDGNA